MPTTHTTTEHRQSTRVRKMLGWPTMVSAVKPVIESGEKCLAWRLSRDMIIYVSVLAKCWHLYVLLGSVSSFRVSSCLMYHDCVLTMSLSGIAKCLVFVETLAFLAKCRPLVPLTGCLLTYCKTVVHVLVALWL